MDKLYIIHHDYAYGEYSEHVEESEIAGIYKTREEAETRRNEIIYSFEYLKYQKEHIAQISNLQSRARFVYGQSITEAKPDGTYAADPDKLELFNGLNEQIRSLQHELTKDEYIQSHPITNELIEHYENDDHWYRILVYITEYSLGDQEIDKTFWNTILNEDY